MRKQKKQNLKHERSILCSHLKLIILTNNIDDCHNSQYSRFKQSRYIHSLCFSLKILVSNLLAFCVKYHVRAWKDFQYQNVFPTFARNYLSWLGFCQLEPSSSYLGKGASSEKIPLPDWLLGKPRWHFSWLMIHAGKPNHFVGCHVSRQLVLEYLRKQAE